MSASMQHSASTEPNLTPILDMVFQLITFFMCTSIALLTLEVYYRYLPLYQLDAYSSLASEGMNTK